MTTQIEPSEKTTDLSRRLFNRLFGRDPEENDVLDSEDLAQIEGWDDETEVWADSEQDSVAPVEGAVGIPGSATGHSYRCAAGSRAYRLYVPSSGGVGAPLVIMLHGGTQTAQDFADLTAMDALAEEHGFLVAYPEQTRVANSMRFWNWFRPANQNRDTGEPAIIAGIIDELVEREQADPNQVFVAGFSAGASMAAIMGHAYPDKVAGIGVHSGVPHGVARTMSSGFKAMLRAPAADPAGQPVPVIAFFGDEDTTVVHGNAYRVMEQFLPLQATDGTIERDDAHTYTRATFRYDDRTVGERWILHKAGHTWSGGKVGRYAEPNGPDASREMVRFFLTEEKTPEELPEQTTAQRLWSLAKAWLGFGQEPRQTAA